MESLKTLVIGLHQRIYCTKIGFKEWVGLMHEAGAKFGGIAGSPRWFLPDSWQSLECKKYGTKA